MARVDIAAARPVVIVTDGMWRKSLSAIRSLGKAGCKVVVFGDSWLTVGFWSRFTGHKVKSPDAKDDIAGFGAELMKQLRKLAETNIRPVLIPMEEDSLHFVVKNAERLGKLADFIVPDAKAFAMCASKADTMSLAQQLGVPHPLTEVVASGAGLLEARSRIPGAFVIKPVHGSGSRGVRYNPAFNPAEADAYIAEFGPSLVQERVSAGGDAIGVSVLFGADGECLAHFTHKRLKEFPNSGGPSTDRTGVDDPVLLEMSLRLLKEIGWRGVAMVEWKAAPQGGQPLLMEINPRFWGSLELAVRSGVDFPNLYRQAAMGRPRHGQAPVTGVRCRWLLPGDILRWLTAGKQREKLGEFLRGLPGSAEEWDGRDFSGFIACIICQGLAVLRPKYLKMLRR